ncbi:MAG: CvpA family protein [Nitrosomonas sp.]|nr:CvpA family protein [Nitrosomonas sp.]
MTVIDYIVLGIGLISVFLGVTRGVIKEIISLAGWFIAFYVASRYAESFEPLLPRIIEDSSLRMLTLFVVVFFVVLLLVMFSSILLSKLIRSVGLGLIDRVLGSSRPY